MERLLLLMHFWNFMGAGLSQRVWQTIFMDEEGDCAKYIRNDNLEEGDMYAVKTDSWQGRTASARTPAECSTNFNFGEQLITVRLVEYRCEKEYTEPFLAVYDNCEGLRISPLVVYRCTNSSEEVVHTITSCVSLYHYRGHVKQGYFFAINIIAGPAAVAFPVGGIAAIFIAIIVATLLVAKIICVITGYERKVPRHVLQCIEDQKDILPYDIHSDNPTEVLPPSPVMQRVPTRDNSPAHPSKREGKNKNDESKGELTSNRHSSPGFVFQNAATDVDNDLLISRSCEDLDLPRPPRPGRCGSSESHSVSFFLGEESKRRSMHDDTWSRSDRYSNTDRQSVTHAYPTSPEQRFHPAPERHTYSRTPDRYSHSSMTPERHIFSSTTPDRRSHGSMTPDRLIHAGLSQERLIGMTPERQVYPGSSMERTHATPERHAQSTLERLSRPSAAARRQNFSTSASKPPSKTIRSCEV